MAERIVHPFCYLVRHDGDVRNGTHENAAGIVVGWGKGLRAVHAAMEAENAARCVGRQRRTARSFALHYVVNQKDREGPWVHTLCNQPGEDRVHDSWLKHRKVDDRLCARRTSA